MNKMPYEFNPMLAEFELRYDEGHHPKRSRETCALREGFCAGYQNSHMVGLYERIVMPKKFKQKYNQGFQEGKKARKKHEGLLGVLFGLYDRRVSLPEELISAIEKDTIRDADKK